MQNSGAAILQFPSEEKKPIIKDGDGEDGDKVYIDNIIIAMATNGWIITSVYDNDEDVTEVFNWESDKEANKKTILAIIESMGLQEEVKLR